MSHYRLEIEGMGCSHCIRAVENALSGLGADINNVQLGSADISFEGSESELKAALEDAGYELKSVAAL